MSVSGLGGVLVYKGKTGSFSKCTRSLSANASCHAHQVSSSCTSVYVDGSESRGALSAEVSVRYGSLQGVAALTVWYPRLPLEVGLEDRRLSQVRGWRTATATATEDRVRREVGGKEKSEEGDEGRESQCRYVVQKTMGCYFME